MGQSTTDRIDYLLECFRTAREELLYRIRHRDNWLKLQLLSQATLLALAHGVRFIGVEVQQTMPQFIFLALPASVVFAGLYFVEDGLLHRLSKYIGRLSAVEADLRSASHVIENWDVSPELRDYTKLTLWFRLLAQTAAFIIFPSVLAYSRIATWSNAMIGFQFGLVLVLVAMVALGFFQRRRTGKIHQERKPKIQI